MYETQYHFAQGALVMGPSVVGEDFIIDSGTWEESVPDSLAGALVMSASAVAGGFIIDPGT